MIERKTGRWMRVSSVGGEPIDAFVPTPLPPDPPIDEAALRPRMDRALVALGRLDGISVLLPEPALFLYVYVRKEAALSSQIEGTESSLSDLLLFEIDEAPGVPLDDVREVSSYVAALEHGLRRMRDGFPLSNRLIREIHAHLLIRGRGSDKEPGEFRRTQNWIGGSRPGNSAFVPPPPHEVGACMSALEKFLHGDPTATPILIKAGLAHVQFETIHPFLDGNGRVGRLLVPLILCADGLLREPLLYLSLHFKQHRDEYYDRLQRVRTDGDWEGWLAFFLDGIAHAADQAVATARTLTTTFSEDRSRIEREVRAAGSALRVHAALQRHPILSIGRAAKETALTIPTVSAALDALGSLGIVEEITGKKRGRLFAYRQYLRALTDVTEEP